MAFSEKQYLSLTTSGYHRIVYSDWGPENGEIIVCVHGLTGNGHDFDFLAEDLVEQGYRLICVDLPGRGRSDFLKNPMDYNYIQYCHDLLALLAHLGIHKPASIDWLGVSLGGLLGIRMAAYPGSPVRRLILNDVGPTVPQKALDFIHQVISQTYTFETIQDMEQRMRDTRGLTWGPMTDEQWNHMAEHNVRALDTGTLTYSYDPAIAEVFATQPIGELDLWPFWDSIQCPVMLIHGAKSVILTPDIIREMHARKPNPDSMKTVVFEDCGHVPSLWAPNQIDAIRTWLNTTTTQK